MDGEIELTTSPEGWLFYGAYSPHTQRTAIWFRNEKDVMFASTDIEGNFINLPNNSEHCTWSELGRFLSQQGILRRRETRETPPMAMKWDTKPHYHVISYELDDYGTDFFSCFPTREDGEALIADGEIRGTYPNLQVVECWGKFTPFCNHDDD